MGLTLLPRSAWTRVPRPDGLTPLTDPVGFSVHYTGSTQAFGSTCTLAQSARRLEAERRMHVHDKGWADCAYQAAADQQGRLFDIRGAGYRSAANGDVEVNGTHGAITILIGVGDTPTRAAVEAVRWWRENVWLPRWPHATAVVGHRDLHSTDCPGDPAYELVRSGVFTRLSTMEDDMPLTDVEIDAIATRARDKILAATYGRGAGEVTLAAVIGEIRLTSARAASVADGLDTVLGRLAQGSPVTLSTDQVEGVAAAIAAHLRASLSSDVVDVLAARLARP